MCHGNLAEASAKYLNAQLGALWANARKCNDTEGPGKIPKDNTVKNGIALREFHGPRAKDGKSTTFHSVFKAPGLEFVCNHELVLYLNIDKGHYEASGVIIDIHNATLAIRLSYNVQVINATLSGCATSISILAVEPASAKLILEKSKDVSSSLFSMIKTHYLPTLIHSGSTNLFELPPSYTARPSIDHSLLFNSGISRDVVFDVELDKINDVLGHHWLSAVGHGNDYAGSSSAELRDTYLSEYRTWWHSSDCMLWVYFAFNPLRAQILCEKEMILFFKADVDLYYSEEEEKKQINKDSSYKNWQVAVVFQVSKVQDRILLDRSVTPRILPKLCFFPSSHDEGDEGDVGEFQEAFKEIILHQYVKLIFEYGHHQLYPDFTSVKPMIPCQCGSPCTCGRKHHTGPKPEPINWPPVRPKHPKIPYCPIDTDDFTINWSDLWDVLTEQTSLHGYHHITSVTQAGINARFIGLWKAAMAASSDERLAVLAHFNSKGKDETGDVAHLPHFKAKFGAPQVELVTIGGRKSVILYYYIQKISFMLESSVHEFKDWILAFEFDLKLLNVELKPETTNGTGLDKHHQLVLNASSAKLRHERSSFAGLADTKSPHITRQLYGNLSKTFIKRYITAFVHSQHHVLYTIPVYSHKHMVERPDAHGRPHAATKFGFSIVPFSLQPFNGRTFQGLCGLAHHIVERNMIVFYCVVGEGKLDKPLPPGPYGARSEDPPYGNLLLSGESFLKPLAKVNALSTILCRIDGVEKHEWGVTLTTWKKRGRSEDGCVWDLKFPEKSVGQLKYIWRNEEDWEYDPDGKAGKDGKYTVKANTENTLTIPTAVWDGPVTIVLEGLSTVHLGLVENGTKNWNGVLEAKWKAILKFVSDPVNGLYLTVKEPAKVVFKKRSNRYTEDVFEICETALTNVYNKFKTVLGAQIDISSILEDLNRSFSGVYQGLSLPHTELVLANPIFNTQGNLFLQLIPKRDISVVLAKEVTSEHASKPLKLGTESWGPKAARRAEAAASQAALRGTAFYSPPSRPTMKMPNLYSNAPTSLTPSPNNTLVLNTPLEPPKSHFPEVVSETAKLLNGHAPETAPKNGVPVFGEKLGDTKAVTNPPPLASATAA